MCKSTHLPIIIGMYAIHSDIVGHRMWLVTDIVCNGTYVAWSYEWGYLSQRGALYDLIITRSADAEIRPYRISQSRFQGVLIDYKVVTRYVFVSLIPLLYPYSDSCFQKRDKFWSLTPPTMIQLDPRSDPSYLVTTLRLGNYYVEILVTRPL